MDKRREAIATIEKGRPHAGRPIWRDCGFLAKRRRREPTAREPAHRHEHNNRVVEDDRAHGVSGLTRLSAVNCLHYSRNCMTLLAVRFIMESYAGRTAQFKAACVSCESLTGSGPRWTTRNASAPRLAPPRSRTRTTRPR